MAGGVCELERLARSVVNSSKTTGGIVEREGNAQIPGLRAAQDPVAVTCRDRVKNDRILRTTGDLRAALVLNKDRLLNSQYILAHGAKQGEK